MNTYIKTNDSAQFAAIRASRATVLRTLPELKLRIVKATSELRSMARMGSIPTFAINANKSLIRL